MARAVKEERTHCLLTFKSCNTLWAQAKASSTAAILASRFLKACLWNSIWAKEQKYFNKKERLNLASMRSYTTPLHSKGLSSNKESREESLKKISTAHNSSIRMLPINTPPLNPLVKSPWVLNSSSNSVRPSTSTENLKKLLKEGPKLWKWLIRKLLNSKESKQDKKAVSPDLGSETITPRASSIVMSPLSGIREPSTLWMVWGIPIWASTT